MLYYPMSDVRQWRFAPARREPQMTRILKYHVNLNERGSFYADVRDENDATLYEVRAGDELGEDETDLVEDGFMRDLMDTRGLTEYLQSLGIIGATDHIIIGSR